MQQFKKGKRVNDVVSSGNSGLQTFFVAK